MPSGIGNKIKQNTGGNMNILKLKGIMIVAGETQASIAEELGISRPALNMKLNGKARLSLEEVQKLAKALMMSSFEITDIFFPEEDF